MKSAKKSPGNSWLWDVLLVIVLLLGAYFRFTGVDWDENHHLHPDERFLTMVESAISPVSQPGEYFDTNQSSLNPHNRGYTFYVYGTLPLFTVRYIAEWLDQTGYGEVYLVGRYVSAAADLLTVFFVYLLAQKLFRKKVLSVLAASFSAFAVLQIQLSHYFTVDIFANLLSVITFYLAVRVVKNFDDKRHGDHPYADIDFDYRALLKDWDHIILYILFGISLGLAVASKISAFPLAFLLPGAVLIGYFQTSPEDRTEQILIGMRNIAVAALVSIIVFRIAQPYAFTGPGLLNIMPNAAWVEDMRELSGQSGGDVDFPPALQWARRPLSFGLENMVKWGLGIPLGFLACAGFIWMGLKIIKGKWQPYALIWLWTLAYFSWQSLLFTSSMRYYLPIYPMLAIIAAWMVISLWSHGEQRQGRRFNWLKALSLLIGIGVFAGTLAWAFAFSRIYTRPVTRVAASQWIYQHVPGPINLHIDTGNAVFNQPIAYPLATVIQHDNPIRIRFTSNVRGSLSEITLDYVLNKSVVAGTVSFQASIYKDSSYTNQLTAGLLTSDFPASPHDPRGSQYVLNFNRPLHMEVGDSYYLVLEALEENSALQVAGPMTLTFFTLDGVVQQPLLDAVDYLRVDNNYMTTITPKQSGILREIYIPHIVDWNGIEADKTLEITIFDTVNERSAVAFAAVRDAFLAEDDPRGEAYTFVLDEPLEVTAGEHITLEMRMVAGEGQIAIYGSKQALETTWDDPLPIGLEGYNPFDYNNGLYRTELNFEMYWEDNAEKLQRFKWILDQADYLFISSNRQWGTTVRVPERYPLTTEYYRALIGCPEEKDILWCYREAEPGMFNGQLGFELVKVFQSDPNIGPVKFNTQYAEEAFTVYDHPKVLIFKKDASFRSGDVREILDVVDLSKVKHLTPGEASKYKGNLTLSGQRLAEQRVSGTWAELFDRNTLFNRIPILSVLLWYLAITLIGWVVYPLTRLIFGGLISRGYPLSKLLGLLTLAYLVWLLGSAGVHVKPYIITLVFLGLVGLNLILWLKNRASINEDVRKYWKYFLLVEGIFLLVLLIDLGIRIGNPDLWHPYKGGEKPMDFAYLNAVLKSANFPPYDPWFAGGYINYYYFGFVMVGVPIKWLGILPNIAYNLVLPTWMGLLALGVFTFGSNLVAMKSGGHPFILLERTGRKINSLFSKGLRAGLFSILFTVFLGNLATVRMIWHGFMKLAAPGGIEGSNIFQRISWTLKGIGQFINGNPLPYGPGDWYWIPSRVFPNEPITEFPFFTFLYADMHAHMIALPITVLALCWGLSIINLNPLAWIKEKTNNWRHLLAILIFGGLIIGSLRPTNTWDLPVYMTLCILAVLYSFLRNGQEEQLLDVRTAGGRKAWLFMLGSLLILIVSIFTLFQPFGRWYAQGYNSINIWEGDYSPFWSYITHWGLFLFIIVGWLLWETREWMASTPVSALAKLRPYRGLILSCLLVLFIAIVLLLIKGVAIAWLVIPLALLAGIHLFRKQQSDMKRVVLFLIGTALMLTLTVELVVLEGDIGRMNTVFKFYMQAWTLLSISASAALAWLLPEVLNKWNTGWKASWQIIFAILLGSAALFTIFASADKVRDRMSAEAPSTLDGMTFMKSSEYFENGEMLELAQDYDAIIWVQDHIEGTPVIVEANTPEYRWASRFSIYTGLPGIVGWNWHQRQQRGVVSTLWVTDRVEDVGHFYRTLDRKFVDDFIEKYQVEYIVVGQLEKAFYGQEGLRKFQDWQDELWVLRYQSQDTSIYEVLQ